MSFLNKKIEKIKDNLNEIEHIFKKRHEHSDVLLAVDKILNDSCLAVHIAINIENK